MKYFLLFLCSYLISLVSFGQAVNSGDFESIKKDKQKYINQPLYILLNDVEHKIKKANIVRPNASLSRPSEFIFYNISQTEYDSLTKFHGKYSAIIIPVRDNLFYDYTSRGIYEYKFWPKNDLDKFKQTIVLDIYFVN
jgi:hypothetical protein